MKMKGSTEKPASSSNQFGPLQWLLNFSLSILNLLIIRLRESVTICHFILQVQSRIFVVLFLKIYQFL